MYKILDLTNAIYISTFYYNDNKRQEMKIEFKTKYSAEEYLDWYLVDSNFNLRSKRYKEQFEVIEVPDV